MAKRRAQKSPQPEGKKRQNTRKKSNRLKKVTKGKVEKQDKNKPAVVQALKKEVGPKLKLLLVVLIIQSRKLLPSNVRLSAY